MEGGYREAPDVATLGPNKKHCFACANILDVRAELCPRCGVRQPQIPAMQAMVHVPHRPLPVHTSKSKVTAGVFALLLGGLGIHKFYLGQVAAGILYILFCWTFIPGIIAFVEGIILLTMSDDDFARKYPG
jgi:TM2 domain-containing membrane protein YozV